MHPPSSPSFLMGGRNYIEIMEWDGVCLLPSSSIHPPVVSFLHLPPFTHHTALFTTSAPVTGTRHSEHPPGRQAARQPGESSTKQAGSRIDTGSTRSEQVKQARLQLLSHHNPLWEHHCHQHCPHPVEHIDVDSLTGIQQPLLDNLHSSASAFPATPHCCLLLSRATASARYVLWRTRGCRRAFVDRVADGSDWTRQDLSRCNTNQHSISVQYRRRPL